MLQTQQSFDSETVALMGRICDAAWAELQKRIGPCGDPINVHTLMALRVIQAVADGERNPERLKAIALRAIDA